MRFCKKLEERVDHVHCACKRRIKPLSGILYSSRIAYSLLPVLPVPACSLRPADLLRAPCSVLPDPGSGDVRV